METLLEAGLARVGDVAAKLAVSKSTVYEMLDRGELQAVRVGRGRRVTWLSVMEWMERQLTELRQ